MWVVAARQRGRGAGDMGLQFKCSLQLAIHWGIFSDATAAAAAESVQAAMRTTSDDFVPTHSNPRLPTKCAAFSVVCS